MPLFVRAFSVRIIIVNCVINIYHIPEDEHAHLLCHKCDNYLDKKKYRNRVISQYLTKWNVVLHKKSETSSESHSLYDLSSPMAAHAIGNFRKCYESGQRHRQLPPTFSVGHQYFAGHSHRRPARCK